MSQARPCSINWNIQHDESTQERLVDVDTHGNNKKNSILEKNSILTEWYSSYKDIMENVNNIPNEYNKRIRGIEASERYPNLLKPIVKHLAFYSYKRTAEPVIDHLADNYCKLLVADTEKSLEKNIDPSIDRWSMAYISLFNDKLRENSKIKEHSDAFNTLNKFSKKTIDDLLEQHLRVSPEECDQKIKESNDEIEKYEQDMTATALCAGGDLSMR